MSSRSSTLARMEACKTMTSLAVRRSEKWYLTARSLQRRFCDQQPIIDYFHKVNDDVVIGLGDIKGKPLEFFFHLTRDQ